MDKGLEKKEVTQGRYSEEAIEIAEQGEKWEGKQYEILEDYIPVLLRQLGVTKAQYTINYNKKSLDKGEYGLYINVFNAVRVDGRNIGTPEVTHRVGKEAKEVFGESRRWSNYSRELVTKLQEVVASELTDPDGNKLEVFASVHGDPDEIVEDFSHEDDSIQFASTLEATGESETATLVTREALRDFALDSDSVLFKKSRKLINALSAIADDGVPIDADDETKTAVRYISKQAYIRLRERLAVFGSAKSDLTRIPSVVEMQAVSKVLKDDSDGTYKNFEELVEAADLNEAELAGIKRILVQFESFDVSGEIDKEKISQILSDYKFNGRHDKSLQSIRVLGRLTMPEGSLMPGSLRAAGVLDTNEDSSESEEEVAAARIVSEIINYLESEKSSPSSEKEAKNFVKDIFASQSNLGIRLPRVSGVPNYNKMRLFLEQKDERVTENERITEIREHIKESVDDKIESIYRMIEGHQFYFTNLKSEFASKLNSAEGSALETFSEVEWDQARELIANIQNQIDVVTMELDQAKDESGSDSLVNEIGSKALEAYLNLQSDKLENLLVKLDLFKSSVDSSEIMRGLHDLGIQVDVVAGEDDVVDEDEKKSGTLAKISRKLGVFRSQDQKDYDNAKRYTLFNEFAYFRDPKLIATASELYLTCMERAVTDGWEAASASATIFESFAKEHLEGDELVSVLQRLQTLQNTGDNHSAKTRLTALTAIASSFMVKTRDAVSGAKTAEMFLSWAAVGMLTQMFRAIASEAMVDIDDENIIKILDYASIGGATTIAVLDAKAKSAAIELAAGAPKHKRNMLIGASAVGILSLPAFTGVIGKSAQQMQYTGAQAGYAVSSVLPPTENTLESLEKSTEQSRDYFEIYKKAQNLYTVGVILTETQIGTQMLPEIKQALVELGFYDDVDAVSFGTPGTPGVGPVTLKKIYALLGEIPDTIELDGIGQVELVTSSGNTYKEIFTQMYANDDVFRSEIDSFGQKRAEIGIESGESFTQEIEYLYSDFSSADPTKEVVQNLDQIFEAIERNEELESLRAQLKAYFFFGEIPNMHIIKRYARITNQSIDELVEEYASMAENIKDTQTSFADVLSSIDAEIEMPNFNAQNLIPDFDYLEIGDVKEVAPPEDRFDALLASFAPNQRMADAIADMEASAEFPNNPVLREQRKKEIAESNVPKAILIGLIIALLPFTTLGAPTAALQGRRRRKAAKEQVPIVKSNLRLHAKKLSVELNGYLKRLGEFPQIEPYMVHRVLSELMVEQGTGELGFDGKEKTITDYGGGYIRSLFDSIASNLDTKAIGAAKRISGRLQDVTPDNIGSAVFVLERLIPGFTKVLRSNSLDFNFSDGADEIKDELEANHYKERIKFIEGHIAALERQRAAFVADESNYSNLASLSNDSNLTDLQRQSAYGQLRKVLALNSALDSAKNDLSQAQKEFVEKSVAASMKKGSPSALTVPVSSDIRFDAHPLSVETSMLESATREVESMMRDESRVPAGEQSLELLSEKFKEADRAARSLQREYKGISVVSESALLNQRTESSAVTITISPESVEAGQILSKTLRKDIVVDQSTTLEDIRQRIKSFVNEAVSFEYTTQEKIKAVIKEISAQNPTYQVECDYSGLFGARSKSVTLDLSQSAPLATEFDAPTKILDKQKLNLTGKIGNASLVSLMSKKEDRPVEEVAELISTKLKQEIIAQIKTHTYVVERLNHFVHDFEEQNSEYELLPEVEFKEVNGKITAEVVCKIINATSNKVVASKKIDVQPLQDSQTENSAFEGEMNQLLNAEFANNVKSSETKSNFISKYPNLFEKRKNLSTKAKQFSIKSNDRIPEEKIQRLYDREILRLQQNQAQQLIKTELEDSSSYVSDERIAQIDESLANIQRNQAPNGVLQYSQLLSIIDDFRAEEMQDDAIESVEIQLFEDIDVNSPTSEEKFMVTIKRNYHVPDSKKVTTKMETKSVSSL